MKCLSHASLDQSEPLEWDEMLGGDLLRQLKTLLMFSLS